MKKIAKVRENSELVDFRALKETAQNHVSIFMNFLSAYKRYNKAEERYFRSISGDWDNYMVDLGQEGINEKRESATYAAIRKLSELDKASVADGNGHIITRFLKTTDEMRKALDEISDMADAVIGM